MKFRLVAALVAFLLTPVAASAAPFSVTTTNDSTTLLNALLGATTGLSGFSLTANGAPEAFGTFAGDDPFGGIAPGVVIGTGFVSELVGPNNVNPATQEGFSDLDQDLGDFGTDGDETNLNITFTSDGSATNLLFNYVFASEEFPEYIGSDFNDEFRLTLNGINYAFLACGQLVAINNFVGACSAELVLNSGNVTPIDGWSKPLTFSGTLGHLSTLSGRPSPSLSGTVSGQPSVSWKPFLISG